MLSAGLNAKKTLKLKNMVVMANGSYILKVSFIPIIYV